MKAIFFSGGYDSTYLLSKLMKEENEIILYSIESKILGPKMNREKEARNKILNYLKAKYYKCNVEINIINIDFSDFNLVNTSGLNQEPIWMSLMMLAGKYDQDIELQLSYCSGDQDITHMEDFINVAKAVSHFRDNNITVSFPMKYMYKWGIIKDLLINDKFLFENATTCEDYNNKDFCGECAKCMELKEALLRIYIDTKVSDSDKSYIKEFIRTKFNMLINISPEEMIEKSLEIISSDENSNDIQS